MSTHRGGPWLITEDWLLLPVAPGHAPAMARLHARNGDYFNMAMSVEPGMDTPAYWEGILTTQQQAMQADSAVHLVGFARGAEGAEIGCTLSFAGIVHDDFQACSMGFKIDRALEGKGLMHAAAAPAISRMFELFCLNRIMATHLPENLRSARLLRRLGFVVEGYARDFVKVNGRWCDNVLLSLLAERPRRPAAG